MLSIFYGVFLYYSSTNVNKHKNCIKKKVLILRTKDFLCFPHHLFFLVSFHLLKLQPTAALLIGKLHISQNRRHLQNLAESRFRQSSLVYFQFGPQQPSYQDISSQCTCFSKKLSKHPVCKQFFPLPWSDYLRNTNDNRAPIHFCLFFEVLVELNKYIIV